ncbi:MAG: M20 family metallo-hydrolase [Syntrophales bacterium]|nr:M20 family metallo-hydrolase [Syntrophales bacterium]
MFDYNVFRNLSEKIESYRNEMIDLQIALTAIPAISPDNGGEGEYERGRFIKHILDTIPFDQCFEINAPDPRAKGGYRPNIIVRHNGRNKRTVWIITHMDVVPPGNLDLWKTDPFRAVIQDGKIYGRGVEDNQQDLISSLFAARVCCEEKVTTPNAVGLIFVSDEETRSLYGLDYVLINEKNPIQSDDIILVPDAGNSDGTLIEVAEKSILWLRIHTSGKQCHGSTPHQGKNAHLAASHLIVRLHNELHKCFDEINTLFDPPASTFEPTKKEANVPNVNTIPGDDVFYMDCRILPQYDLKMVLAKIKEVAKEIETIFGVSIEVEPIQELQSPPPTSTDAPVVKALQKAIREVYSVEAKPRGIGAGTVAAYLRKREFPVAVWSRTEHTAHQPNEFCLIDNMVGNAKVFLHLFLQDY